jgi:hypothetical protein
MVHGKELVTTPANINCFGFAHFEPKRVTTQ